MSNEQHQFFATTALGMEESLIQELQGLGALEIKKERAGATFRGNLEIAYRACLWSRIANRILLPLATFSAPDPDRLYGGVRKIHWTDHLTVKNTLAVDFSSSHSTITHTHFGALKVKDAIVDQFRSVQGDRPSVNPLQPDLRINVYLNKDIATVSIDLSGDSLHRRGYREDGARAPLKENLAAAILMRAGWPKSGETSFETSFLDPMCGSGTLPIEAGLMAGNIAPGIQRKYFGFKGWQGHIPTLWKRLLEEANDVQIRDKKKFPRIVGYDEDFRAVRTALSNIEKAGLHGKVHIEKRELSQSEAPTPQGILVTNPPYGERLGEVEALKPLYERLGDTLKQRFKGWEGYVFTGSPDLAKSIGLKANQRIVLFNGPIECRLLKFSLY
jgi:23S rRNA (guanine2445-N2)-methyltransferase / 23S rRNA (guanine2069-N7)-methyltransferase